MHQTAFHYPELAGFKAEGTSQEAANAIEGSGQAGKSISGHSQNVLAMTPANERIAA